MFDCPSLVSGCISLIVALMLAYLQYIDKCVFTNKRYSVVNKDEGFPVMYFLDEFPDIGVDQYHRGITSRG